MLIKYLRSSLRFFAELFDTIITSALIFINFLSFLPRACDSSCKFGNFFTHDFNLLSLTLLCNREAKKQQSFYDTFREIFL